MAIVVPAMFMLIFSWVNSSECFGFHNGRVSFGRHTTTQLSSNSQSAVERLDLAENFNRWRFMQHLLDEELPAHDVNQVLFALLDSYSKKKRRDPDESAAPERTQELLEVVNGILTKYKDIIPILCDPGCKPGDESLLMEIEKLLPDPVEKEDAHKGAWDTVMELHGRSAVAFNEKEARPEWKAVCTIARVLIYFEFLSGDGLEV